MSYGFDDNNDQAAKKQELIQLIREAGDSGLENKQFERIREILNQSPPDWKLSNTKKKDGTSILMIAARNGLSKLVGFLLEQGAHVSSVNRDHCDALMFACFSGKLDIVEPILLAKADVNFKNKQGITAAMVAAERGHEKILKKLIDTYHVSVDLKMKNGANALIFAISNKHQECVELLLKSKADPNEPLKDGTTPLMLAAERNHPQIIQLLLAANANVNATRGKVNETALHFACNVTNGPLKATVQRLLDAKADVHTCDHEGRTALMYAVPYQDITTLLLNANADINTPDDGGNTALMYACAQGANVQAVLHLVNHKAEVEAKNERGENAISISSALGKSEATTNLLTMRLKQKKK